MCVCVCVTASTQCFHSSMPLHISNIFRSKTIVSKSHTCRHTYTHTHIHWQNEDMLVHQNDYDWTELYYHPPFSRIWRQTWVSTSSWCVSWPSASVGRRKGHGQLAPRESLPWHPRCLKRSCTLAGRRCRKTLRRRQNSWSESCRGGSQG